MMSVSAYGRRRGCSHEAVRRAIKSGRLDKSVVIDGHGHPKIADPDLADQEWQANTSQIMQVDNKAVGDSVSRAKGGDGVNRSPQTKKHTGNNGASTPAAGSFVAGSNNDQLNKARAAKATYEARIAELTLKKMNKEVVDAAEVQSQFATASRRVQNNLLTIPDRISSIIAAESDPDRVREIITKEIERSLTALADEGGFPADG